MSLAPPLSRTSFDQPRVHRITRAEYYLLADGGSFRQGRFELIEGEVIEMPPQKNPHALSLTLTDYVLRRAFGEGYFVRVQLPFRVSDVSEPEPDLAVIAGSPRDYTDHPSQAAMIVEIADATLALDRDRKAPLYAGAGVPEYWIVNLIDRQIEIYRGPTTDAQARPKHYPTPQFARAGDFIAPLAAPSVQIRVADLLP